MHAPEREMIDILTQVRAHLELQRALGVTGVETAAPAPRQPAAAGPRHPVPAPPRKETGGSDAAPRISAGLDGLREELAACTRCGLAPARKSVVFGEGSPRAALVFVGEGPGREEDRQGRPACGPAGALLTDIIVKGMKLRREDVYICDIVKCRLPEDRGPRPDEVAACEEVLIRQIEAIKPKVIVALGGTVAQSLLKTAEPIETLRGTWRRYRGIPLMPTLDPARLLKNPADKKAVWEDIKKVMAEMGKKG